MYKSILKSINGTDISESFLGDVSIGDDLLVKDEITCNTINSSNMILNGDLNLSSQTSNRVTFINGSKNLSTDNTSLSYDNIAKNLTVDNITIPQEVTNSSLLSGTILYGNSSKKIKSDATLLFNDSTKTITTNNLVVNTDLTMSNLGAVRIPFLNGNKVLKTDSGAQYDINTGTATYGKMIITTSLNPSSSNSIDLGTSSLRYKDCYLVNSPNVSSDANMKQNITTLDENDTVNFINRLRPVKYQFINGQSGRYHHGLIAQELKESILNHGMTTQDMASYCEEEYLENGELKTSKSIRYEELIALLISSIQNLDKRVKQLEK